MNYFSHFFIHSLLLTTLLPIATTSAMTPKKFSFEITNSNFEYVDATGKKLFQLNDTFVFISVSVCSPWVVNGELVCEIDQASRIALAKLHRVAITKIPNVIKFRIEEAAFKEITVCPTLTIQIKKSETPFLLGFAEVKNLEITLAKTASPNKLTRVFYNWASARINGYRGRGLTRLVNELLYGIDTDAT